MTKAKQMVKGMVAVFFLIYSFCLHEKLWGEIQWIELRELDMKDCFLPDDHPLQSKLKKLFKDRSMFRSHSHLENLGFYTLTHKEEKIMVAGHPDLKSYLIKKFSDANSSPKAVQLNNYLKRIAGARALKEFIDLNHLKHIVVPQKWLYELPAQFNDAATGEKSYVLIVEDMDIYTEKGSRGRAAKYQKIKYDILKELCIVVYYFRGLDSVRSNLAFTNQNKISFIDTECWDEWDREGFLARIMPYLKPRCREYAKKVFKELCEQDTREEICRECMGL